MNSEKTSWGQPRVVQHMSKVYMNKPLREACAPDGIFHNLVSCTLVDVLGAGGCVSLMCALRSM